MNQYEGCGRLKRFIRYLYEYEQGKRLRNVGFIKAEQGMDECVLHIHGKGLGLNGEKVLKLYLFYVDGSECVGIWQGDAQHVNPAINYRMYYTSEDTGGQEIFDRIDGIILETADQRRFAAVWDDTPVNIGNMRIWDPEKEAAAEEETIPEEEDVLKEETAPAEQEPLLEEEKETAAAEEKRQVFFCQKIQRNELAKLPRCEWKLSNNSFLLHGYYNYHHLMLLDDGEWLRLGVPGLFHPKEAKAAQAFGFPEFIRRRDIEVELEDEEQEDEEKFGYWCRCVKRKAAPCSCS